MHDLTLLMLAQRAEMEAEAEKSELEQFKEILATYWPRGNLGATSQRIQLLARVLTKDRPNSQLELYITHSLLAAYQMGRESVGLPLSPVPLIFLAASSGILMGFFFSWLFFLY